MCLFVFFRGDCINSVVLEYRQRGSFERNLKVLVPFLGDQKIRGQLGPPPRSFSPMLQDQNFEVAISFSFVYKSNKYVFEDDLIPRGLQGRGYKLW